MSRGAQVLVQRLWEQHLVGKSSTAVKHKERHSIQNGYNLFSVNSIRYEALMQGLVLSISIQ